MGSARTIEAVLFDVDGVLRHWARSTEAQTEAAFGLPAGAVRAAAFDNEIERRVLVGAGTFDDWKADVDSALVEAHGARAEGAAAAFFEVNTFEVDTSAVELLAQVRTRVPAGLFSNGTDLFESEMAELGIEADWMFNGHRIGFAKPDARAFRAVAEEVGVEPEHIFFTDDREENVAGARACGWTAWRFTGVEAAVRDLTELGVL